MRPIDTAPNALAPLEISSFQRQITDLVDRFYGEEENAKEKAVVLEMNVVYDNKSRVQEDARQYKERGLLSIEPAWAR